MSTRRLEEILEECLSAYLDGRRSIEQSLSIYPSVASELEPLLRTATDVSSTFGSYSPPAHVQQRGLNRFLSDAHARRNIKALRVSGSERSRFGIMWQKYRLSFAGAAMAVFVIAGSIGAASLISSGNSTSTVANLPTPAAVINLQNAIQTIRDRNTRGEAVDPSELAHLLEAAQAIQNSPSEDILPVRDAVANQLKEADTLVSNVAANQPEVAQQAAQTQKTIRQVAAALPTTPTASAAAASATATAAPTSVVTPTPTSGVPTGTPVPPTEAPTPTLPPPPSDTPPPRAPAGFAP